MKIDREQVILNMCFTMRHDYGLEKQPGHGILSGGMTDVERKILYSQMCQIYDNVFAPLLEQEMSEQVKRFYIAEEHLTNVPMKATVTVRDLQADRPTTVPTHGIEDHPEFDRLRHQLGDEGYIRIERLWWNGDRVLRSFYLNDCLFNQGDQFPCASAMKYLLKSKGTKCI